MYASRSVQVPKAQVEADKDEDVSLEDFAGSTLDTVSLEVFDGDDSSYLRI